MIPETSTTLLKGIANGENARWTEFVEADGKLKAFLDEDEVMTWLVFRLATL